MRGAPYLFATQLDKAIQAREITTADALELCLTRVEQHNPALNAVLQMDAAGARDWARRADAATARTT